jgi:hypothetical protein
VAIRGGPRCLVRIAPRRVGVDTAVFATIAHERARSFTVQVAFDVIAPMAGRLLCTCARSSRTERGLPPVLIVSSHQSSQRSASSGRRAATWLWWAKLRLSGKIVPSTSQMKAEEREASRRALNLRTKPNASWQCELFTCLPFAAGAFFNLRLL